MSDLLQVLIDTPAQPQGKFYSGGTLTNLDGTCTVILTKLDGTAGPASGTVTNVATGIYQFSFAAPADPIVYNVAWSGAIGTKPVTIHTRIEVLGSLLFTIPALRALKVEGNYPFAANAVPLFTDTQLMDARAAVTDEFEAILGFPPVPRHRRLVLDGTGRWTIPVTGGVLKDPRLLSISINGVAGTVGSYVFNDASELESVLNYGYGAAITAGRRNVVVELVNGWARVPGDGGNVAMLRAAMRLLPSFAETAQTVSVEGVTYQFDPAGQVTRAGHTRHFGIPAIDSWLNRWAEIVPAVA